MDPSEETIRRLAHQLWEAGGRRNDSHESDWLRAERMVREAQQSQSAAQQSHSGTRAAVRVDESVRESFPASDAPSTHTPDIRPANADAKWAAARAAAEKAQQNEASPDRAIKERKRSGGSRH
jgi:hypothetical protein